MRDAGAVDPRRPRKERMPPSLEIFAFSDAESQGARLAEALGAPMRPIEVHAFPDGESLVRAPRAAGDRPARTWIVRSLNDPNRKLVEVLLAADALRRQDADWIGLVAPYLGYMRQDRVFTEGEAVSQQVIARLLGQAFDDVLTVEAHLHRIHALADVFPGPARSLSAAPLIAEWLRGDDGPDLLVGPDGESEPWVRAIAERVPCAWAVASKTRLGDREVRIELPGGRLEGQRIWVVDDIGSSGTTLERVARILTERGAASVGAVVVHALFEPGAEARLRAAGIDRLVSTNAISHATNAIDVTPLIAAEIEAQGAAHEEG